MTQFSALWGAYNVEGTINASFLTGITAKGVPSWMTSARVVTDYGREQQLISGYSGHAFALTHLAAAPVLEFEGGIADNGTGGRVMKGTLEADAWLSKSIHKEAYQAHLRQMRDMISLWAGTGSAVMITNVYGSTATAQSISSIVRLAAPRFEPAGPDLNPDYIRVRALIDYSWIERVG